MSVTEANMTGPAFEGPAAVAEKWNLSGAEKRTIALKRAAELRAKISGYLEEKELIKTGFDFQETAGTNRDRILKYFNATESDWHNWRWQLSRRISDTITLAGLFGLSESRCARIRRVGMRYRWSISPYYASLMDTSDLKDPIILQSLPSPEEMDEGGHADPMAEEFTSPAPCVTRRYPDHLIINVTNKCAMYCRHCQRRRNIGEADRHRDHLSLVAALDYIRSILEDNTTG